MKSSIRLHRLPAALAIVLVLSLLLTACAAQINAGKTTTVAAPTKAAAAAGTPSAATKAPAGATAVPTTAATKSAAGATVAPTTAATKAAGATTAPTTAATKAPAGAPTAVGAPPAAAVSFAKDVLPIFQKNCIRCHGGSTPRSNLSLESYHNALQGGTNAPDLIPGNPDRSNLCVFPRDGLMPLGGPKLATADAQTICNWIAQGALDN